MKKTTLLLLSTIGTFNLLFSQPLMQASIGAGSTANSVKIYIRPAATQTPANLSTLQFNVGISSTITPKPNLAVVSSTLSGVTWVISQATEGGFYNYQITTATSPVQPNLTANVEFEVMELAFSGGPLALNNVLLVSLPDGGAGASSGNSLFLCTGSLASAGNNLYFTRTGTTVNNQFSYDASGATSGTTTSTATVANISLPLAWQAFSVQKQANVAILNWKVSNQNNNDYFTIEVSEDGISFNEMAVINQSMVNAYSYTDQNFAARRNKLIYYRIKQTDKDGKYSYSSIATIENSGKVKVTIGPNPASEFVTISGNNLQLVEFFNLEGRRVKSINLNNTSSSFVLINNLINGIYQLKITDIKGNVQVEKLVKQ